jgi:hypothetical protein
MSSSLTLAELGGDTDSMLTDFANAGEVSDKSQRTSVREVLSDDEG